MNPIDGILHMDNTNDRISRFEQCFQEQRSKAVNAVFYIEPSIIEEMIDAGEFDTALLEDIGMESIEDKIPLQYLVKCWDIILLLQGFQQRIRPRIEQMRTNNDKMKECFRKRLGIDIDALEIKFWDLHGILRLSAVNETVEDIFDKTMEQLLAEGSRREDVLLYCESLKFNVPEVEKLLEEGADCWALFEFGSERLSAADIIYTEVNYLCSEVLWMVLVYQDKPCSLYDIRGSMQLDDFLSWAAYELIIQAYDKHYSKSNSKK